MGNRKIKILAIDGNADSLIRLKAFIMEVYKEANVLTTLDGDEGINIALSEDPDVILLDVIMPGMDGYEVCRKIKSHVKLSDIPVVFVTTLTGDKESRLRVLEAGAEAFLTKPVDEAELIAKIRAMETIKANRVEKRNREEHLARLVEEQTRELKMTHNATLELLEDLKKEVEAHKKSEEDLRESEERYRAFFENSMDAILLTQPDGKIVSANSAACEMFGRTEEELVKLGREGVIDRTDHRLTDILAERKKAGRAKGEVRLIRKNGEVFSAELSSALFKNSSGEVFTSMIIRDIALKLEAEKTIENERLLLRTLINNIPDSIYSKDLLCRKTLVNPKEIWYMGVKLEEDAIGKTDFDVYPKEIADRFYADDQLILETGKPLLNREELLYDKHGEKKWLLSSKLPLRDRDGQVIGLVGIGRDITDLKERELAHTMQYNIATAMVYRKSLQELFEIIKHDLNQLMEAENLTLAMINYETGMLYSPVDFEKSEENPQSWPAEASLTGWLIKQKKSCLLTHPELEKLAEDEKLVRYGPESECWMGVPLFDGDMVVGAIILQSYKNRDAYDSNSVRIIEVVASQLSSYMKRLNAEETALKLTKVVEQSPDSILITDINGIIEYANPKLSELTGYSPEEIIGQSPRIFQSGEHPKSFYTTLWNTLLAGKDWHGEILNRKKDGNLYWENASIAPLLNNKGEVTHYIAVKDEITEKKKSEEALKFHAALQSLLIKIASGYINVHVENLDGTVKSSLEEMGRFAAADRAYVFEYDWEKQIARNTYEWCAEGVSPQITNLQNLDVYRIEAFVNAHLKGEAFYLADVMSLENDDPLKQVLELQEIKSTIALPMMEGQNCTGFVGFDWITDHHDYSEGEKVLLSIFSQLLVNVKIKTRLEYNLIIEKERAEAADRLKTAFLNNISHEVRTPINGILGFGNMLMQPGISEEEKNEYFDILQISSNRLIDTITSFMDISLLTSGNMSVAKKKFSLHSFLNKLYEFYKNEILNKNIELLMELNKKKDAVLIETDEDILKKIFHYIIENSIKFTTTGHIRLGYLLKEKKIEFFVEDTGKGIEPDKVSTVFEPFVQEDLRLSRGYEGSGLGLSISKGLVELLGGSIAISSEKGCGTIVTFTLPGADISAKEIISVPADLNGNDFVVLIAEDDSVNRLYLEMILNHADIKCISVENGIQAVDACRENFNISIVLMDLKMPVMGGLEATRLIKQFRPDLPVVAVSAHAMKDDIKLSMEAGCDDYLTKPFNQEVLLEKVFNVLGRHSQRNGRQNEFISQQQ